MELLDTMRHDALFNKHRCTLPVHLIGAGGVASHVAYQFAKLGVGTHPVNTVFVYDDDRIEPHNPPNQAYTPFDIGKKKVDALSEHFKLESGGNTVTTYDMKVKSHIPLEGIVCLCLDKMQDRKDIIETSVFGNPKVKLCIETRMDARHAASFAFDPNNMLHREIWEQYWFPDKEAQNIAGCGGHLSVITAVLQASILAVEQFMAFSRRQEIDDVYNHVRISLDTWKLTAQKWRPLLDEK